MKVTAMMKTASKADAAAAVGRRAIAKRAARARWRRVPPKTAAEAPVKVRQLLRSYDPIDLDWSDPRSRWAVVGEVITRGGPEAWAWVLSVMSRADARDLAKWAAGACYSEPKREKIRKKLRLGVKYVPRKPYLGFL